MFDVKITYDVNLVEVGEIIFNQVKDVVTYLTEQLYNEIQQNLHGLVLQSRSAKLAGSMRQEITSSTDQITGRVFSEGVDYARILEEGGTTPAHIITPKNALVLAFGHSTDIAQVITSALSEMSISRNKILTGAGGGYSDYAERVQHPGSRIPAFGYMARALDRVSEQVDPAIQDAIREALIIAHAESEEEEGL